MPELPEAETLALQLANFLTGLTVSKVSIRRASILKSGTPADFEKFLTAKKIVSADRRGKVIALIFENDCRVWFHLGMTGQFIWDWQEDDAKHVHAVFAFSEVPQKLAFRDIRRFGGLSLTTGPEMPQGVRGLGPEPLKISEQDLKRCLYLRKGRIKSLLLNQKIMAGLGNIYVDECLFRAGIDPRKKSYRLQSGKWPLLHQAIQKVLKEAIAAGGSSIDDFRHLNGARGEYQKYHRVYGKAGKPCQSCGTEICRIRLAGRSSFYCPVCQN